LNTIKELKQQEKYNNMLKRKNKKIKELEEYFKSDIEIRKGLIYRIKKQEKEIKRLNDIIKELQRRERQLSFIKIRKQP
jgi:uncharacterized protein (UPF0216 family)